ncbi:hypothetical protein MLD38_006362 [Melastoma candidum]|uniref:Uncharacterized protein n=1 Tax=Melastoma candidum TaxID=119954 RepID=A0ACB9RMP5_9MYRT|nr:hypothetical protein MLD38_006362 [Melastoma candidum]
MGRAPCCDKASVKRGPWSPDEDKTLCNFILTYGTGGNWITLPKKAGLKRCGKSCRLRWLNYLRPDIRHGGFTEDEDAVICGLYKEIGSRWSFIASHLQGRTDNDVKNYWNTRLKKKLLHSEKGTDRNPKKTGSTSGPNADFEFPLPACPGFPVHDNLLALLTSPAGNNTGESFVQEFPVPSTNTTCSSSSYSSSNTTNASSSVSSMVEGSGNQLDYGFGFPEDEAAAAGGGGGWNQDNYVNYFSYYIC